jgi:hypothetical protein
VFLFVVKFYISSKSVLLLSAALSRLSMAAALQWQAAVMLLLRNKFPLF